MSIWSSPASNADEDARWGNRGRRDEDNCGSAGVRCEEIVLLGNGTGNSAVPTIYYLPPAARGSGICARNSARRLQTSPHP
jgi:hypothetical protein